jgi:HAD superfamily hydrolase (TIGR01509 family)
MRDGDPHRLRHGLGFAMEPGAFFPRYGLEAVDIHARARVTPGTVLLIDLLRARGFRLGQVTASPPAWIGAALRDGRFREAFDAVISLEARPDLRPKPAPDGYSETMRRLGSLPATIVVPGDSNHGIRAAKAGGVQTIGFRGNLGPGYAQSRADFYADTMDEVGRIVRGLGR